MHSMASRLSPDVELTVAEGGDPGYLADYIAQNIPVDVAAKQEPDWCMCNRSAFCNKKNIYSVNSMCHPKQFFEQVQK